MNYWDNVQVAERGWELILYIGIILKVIPPSREWYMSFPRIIYHKRYVDQIYVEDEKACKAAWTVYVAKSMSNDWVFVDSLRYLK